MVVANLMGGLGNQMFQYAAGRALSLRLNTVLKLDHTYLERDSGGDYTQRHYELGVFNVQAEKASAEDLQRIDRARSGNFLTKLFSRNGFTIVNEKGFPYNVQIEDVVGDVYLHGFWQSEKYFRGIRQTILSDFTLRATLSPEALRLKEKISAATAAVSVHFRRGDYVKLASASAFHGTAELDFYRQAVALIKEKIASPEFFIFSDEIDWVRENFKLEGAVYVSGLKGYEDLELMKRCRHNITANSSFSWWGAWLNPEPAKVVIAPKKWFRDASINTADLIPASWISL
jgi:hypothetical protein